MVEIICDICNGVVFIDGTEYTFEVITLNNPVGFFAVKAFVEDIHIIALKEARDSEKTVRVLFQDLPEAAAQITSVVTDGSLEDGDTHIRFRIKNDRILRNAS